jgi:hypothetical protein
VFRRRARIARGTFIRRIVEESKARTTMREWVALAPHLGA